MMGLNQIIKSFLLFLCLLTSIWAADEGVAKVIILKGSAAYTLEGKSTPLTKGAWLPEGATVATQEKSFVKLLFIDKSSMNVGPESEMQIKTFPKNDAGIISLVKGQIRSKVTKNYMDIKKKDKSKLFIKTKTAAMGVRGTDFQVNYNPINESTSLVTFHGAVAMAKIDPVLDRTPASVNQQNLEQVVSSDKAVMVKKGQYSGVSPKLQRATIPVKISPSQLETLKSNEAPGFKEETSDSRSPASKKQDQAPAKKFRGIVPPGLDAKQIASDSKELDKVVSAAVGSEAVKKVDVEMKQESEAVEAEAPPEGMLNPVTGEVAPTAGGYVDLGTAQYIPPPPGSAYDSNAGVYVPPPEFGRVDPETGDYKNDNYDLTAEGTFVAKETKIDANQTVDGSTTSRAPASADEGSTTSEQAPPPPKVGPMPTLMDEGSFDSSVLEAGAIGEVGHPQQPLPGTHDARDPASADTLDPNAMEAMADDITNENAGNFEDEFENTNIIQNTSNTNSTNVNFEINIQ